MPHPRESKICKECGATFNATNNSQKYCLNCGYQGAKTPNGRYKYRKKPCLDCGKPRAYNAKHCLCRPCLWKHPEFHIGGAETNYRRIKVPDHPRAGKDGYVFQHIYIWEQKHGKSLPSDWVIHHLNGIRSDNRPENLFAMPLKCHHSNLIARELKKRIRFLEMENRKLKTQLPLPIFPIQ